MPYASRIVLDLRLLSHALALATHGSFARAARAVHLSQPALSRSIQSLEGQLGIVLFERGRNGVEPTDAGQFVLKKARELIRHAEEMEGEAGALVRADDQGLRVATGPYPARLTVPRAIAHCLGNDPDFRVVAKVDSWVGVVAAVQERKAEIGLCETSELDASYFEVMPLRPRQGRAVARIGHPLAGKMNLELADVAAYPVALTGRLPPRMLGKLLPMGTAHALPSIRCECIEMVLEIVGRSDAITFLTEPMLPAVLASGKLAKLDFAPPWLHSSSGLIKLKEHRLSPLGRAFWDAVLEVDAEMA